MFLGTKIPIILCVLFFMSIVCLFFVNLNVFCVVVAFCVLVHDVEIASVGPRTSGMGVLIDN